MNQKHFMLAKVRRKRSLKLLEKIKEAQTKELLKAA